MTRPVGRRGLVGDIPLFGGTLDKWDRDDEAGAVSPSVNETRVKKWVVGRATGFKEFVRRQGGELNMELVEVVAHPRSGPPRRGILPSKRPPEINEWVRYG